MKDGRLTVYFNSEDRKVMQEIIARFIGTDLRFRESEAEFIRYCVRFTVEHDNTLINKKETKSV